MKEFFAGGNTAAGFVNYLPRYVEGLKNIILLYGCPGCGKSSLLKRFAAKAEGKGYEVTAIRCSSDADSLDGIVVPALSLGIVDATAPHVINPIYPLAVERIVDLTQFAATPCRSEKSRIIRLASCKKEHYRMGYAYLAAAAKAREAVIRATKPYIDLPKLYAFADRRIKECRLTGGTEFGQITAFGGGGECRLDFAGKCGAYCFDGSVLGVANAFFEYLLSNTAAIKRTLSMDAFDAQSVADALIGCTHFASHAIDGASVIHDKRFVKRGMPRQSRKLINELTAKAQSEFAKAALLHAELEKIYVGLIDFDAYAEYRDKLISTLLA